MAERFGRLGTSVIVNYSGSEDHARETIAAIQRQPGTAIAVQADVSNVADIDRLCATAIEHFGRLDIVVANAGVEVTGKSAHKITFRPTILVRGRSLITVRSILLVAGRQP